MFKTLQKEKLLLIISVFDIGVFNVLQTVGVRVQEILEQPLLHFVKGKKKKKLTIQVKIAINVPTIKWETTYLQERGAN